MTTQSIVAFLNLRKFEIDKIVDQTYFRLREGFEAINQYMPFTEYPDVQLLVAQFQEYPTIASIMGDNEDIPVRKPNAILNEVLLGQARFGLSYYYQSKDFEYFHKLQERLAMGGRGAEAYERYFYKRAETLTESTLNLLTYLYIQVIQTGGVTYTDPFSNTQFSLTYPTESTLFPTALAGGNTWDNIATAQGINDLYTLSKAWYDVLGFYPYATMLSTQAFRQLQAQYSTKLAVLSARGSIGVVAGGGTTTTETVLSNFLPSMEEINATMQRRDIPPLVLFDAQYQQENPNGTFSRLRYSDPSIVNFLTKGMGERALMGYPENDFNPGVRVESFVESTMPRREVSRAMAAGVPFISDPRFLSALKVTAS
jgi:hypothetical protein